MRGWISDNKGKPAHNSEISSSFAPYGKVRDSRVEGERKSPEATYRVWYSQYVLFVLHSPSLFVRPLVVATVSALLRNPHHVTRLAAASFPQFPPKTIKNPGHPEPHCAGEPWKKPWSTRDKQPSTKQVGIFVPLRSPAINLTADGLLDSDTGVSVRRTLSAWHPPAFASRFCTIVRSTCRPTLHCWTSLHICTGTENHFAQQQCSAVQHAAWWGGKLPFGGAEAAGTKNHQRQPERSSLFRHWTMDAATTTCNSNSNSQLRLASAVQCGRALGRASRIEPLPRLQLSCPRLALDFGDASQCLALALETPESSAKKSPE
ncbi:hypothetical protein Landi51_07615 [Colletotrichum acutatum]